jgi:hypothetical protein
MGGGRAQARLGKVDGWPAVSALYMLSCSSSVELILHRWSQSRLRNEFLYYDEKLPITQEEREMKAARRAE